MWTKFGAGVAALGVMAAGGMGVEAADLGPPGPPPAYYDGPTRIERWTGFYFGASGGYVGGDTGVSGASGAFDYGSDGGVGSIFAGFNWQANNLVYGIEADIGLGSLDGSASSGGTTLSQDLDVFGSVRARLGLLVAPELLVYATGGVAWADIDYAASGFASRSDTLTGYQVGGGAELALAPQWTLRAEYLYTDLPSTTINHGGGLTNTYDSDFHMVRGGLALKF